MRHRSASAYRTRAYIDRYNLYYGCLKNSPHKWLDVRALIERVLSNVQYEVNGEPRHHQFPSPAVKYFTAPILKAFARSADSISCLANYNAALAGHLGADIEVINGYYDARPARAHKWEEGKAARECGKINIWKLEEKQTDVALALHAYSDAVRGEVNQIIVVTNDADAQELRAYMDGYARRFGV